MDVKKEAENVYARITSYANYDQMNGIEKEWIIKCIKDGLEAYAGSKLPTMEEMNDQFETLFPGLPKHCMKKLGFELCYDWLKNLAKPSKKP